RMIQIRGWPPKPVAGETVNAREPLKVTFSAVHTYRGETGKEVSVKTGLGMGDCGFDFQKGNRYLVFAHKEDTGDLTTSICTGTSLLKDAGNSLRLLGVKPAEADDSQEEIDDSNHRICGRISGASRENIDAGQVMAWRVEDDDIALFRSQETDIKPDGQYCLDELPPGKYIVAAMQDLEVPDRRRIAYYPGVLTHAGAPPVPISAESKSVRADFSLQPQHLYNVRGYLRGASTNESIKILLMSKNLNKLTVIDPAELESNGSFQFD